MTQQITNPFLALAKALWEQGQDGEMLAIQLTEAFKHVVHEGTGAHTLKDYIEEFKVTFAKVRN